MGANIKRKKSTSGLSGKFDFAKKKLSFNHYAVQKFELLTQNPWKDIQWVPDFNPIL